MYTRLRVEGLNLEKLLRTAVQEGIALRQIHRADIRHAEVSVPAWQMRRFDSICQAFGWRIHVLRASRLARCLKLIRHRCALIAGLALCMAMVCAADGMILAVRIENAGENIAEVRTFLREEGVAAGRRKASISLDDMRAKLALRLPGLSFTGLRYEGSVLIADCYPAEEGEQNDIGGRGNDIVAAQSGIVTRMYVQCGTPAVMPGQAVRKGQVLIRGEERTQKGMTASVCAQGQVHARVWAQGNARASLWKNQTVETGRERRRVTVHTPWHQRVVQEAQPFASQDVSVQTQRVVGLYLPLWRSVETYAETVVHRLPASRSDAASWAQQAAEEIAKNGCPYDALILDKWVDYSMIDNEFVYATVVLEYETPIAARAAASGWTGQELK